MKYKYIYIISLLLSSLFTYKHIEANTYNHLHAFFIPKNAFINNTQIKEIPSSQASVFEENISSPTQEQISETSHQELPSNTTSHTKKSNTVKKETTSNLAKKQTAPLRQITVQKAENKQPAQTIPQPTLKQNKPTNYKLDDKIPTQTKQSAPQEKAVVTTLQNPHKKEIKELLQTIPFPNFQQPKFKQLYALYGLELRTLHKQKKLPENSEQEETLSKANSMRRFTVK